MTDFTRYAVTCHHDSGQVEHLGLFTTDVAAKGAAINHATAVADELDTRMSFNLATMTAKLRTGDVLDYRLVVGHTLEWSIYAGPTAQGIRISYGPVQLSLSVAESIDLRDGVAAALVEFERLAFESDVALPMSSEMIEDLQRAAASTDWEPRGV